MPNAFGMPDLEEEKPQPQGGLNAFGMPALPDPNRDPIPGSIYDLSILQKPYMETLLPGSSMREGPAENAAKRLVDYNLGLMGKAAYWVDRPYTGVMSIIDAATQGKKMGEILSEGWKGFTGSRNVPATTSSPIPAI